jgi:hypothetical protein
MLPLLLGTWAGAAFQAAPTPSLSLADPPEDWTLPSLRVIRPCPDSEGDEIVVCGRPDDDRYRLPTIRIPNNLDVEPDDLLRFGLGEGAEGEVEVSQQLRSDGWLDRRIMLHIRFGF